MFIQLAKYDQREGLAYGVMAASVPDKSGEIMDWPTGRAAIEKWSNEISAATGGENVGNVRLMHGKVAAGKLVKIEFDDERQEVRVCAKAVSDEARRLLDEHVITGFSIGGGYARTWTDPANRALKRYTPKLTEVSFVDSPCIPTATITLVKADGAEELFKADEWGKPYEPSNDEVKERAGELAKAAGKPGRAQDYVVKARSALIAEAAEEPALEKVDPPAEATPEALLEKALAEADALTKGPKPYGDVDYADPKAGKYPIDTAAHIRAAWSYINMPKNAEKVDDADAVKAKIVAAWKAKISADGPPGAEKAAFITDLCKSGAAGPLLAAVEAISLEKGLYSVRNTAAVLAQMSEIASDCVWEEKWENDEDSTLPQGAVDLVHSIRSFLIDQINEETAEFFAACEQNGGDGIALLAPMELAAPVADLHKLQAEDGSLEKIGRRNNSADQKRVQAMHDHCVALGADCPGAEGAAKVEATGDMAKVADELAASRRLVVSAIPTIQALTKRAGEQDALLAAQAEQLTKLAADIEALNKGPGVAKGRLVIVDKATEMAAAAGLTPATDDEARQARILGKEAPDDPDERREWALIKVSGASGQTVGSLPAPGGDRWRY